MGLVDRKMLITTILLSWALAARASPLLTPRQDISESLDLGLTVVDAHWDGQCFYPEGDDDFELEDYLGRWYQVAGTAFQYTAGCSCVYAEYSLNDNGTVNVFNSCQLGNRTIDIQGTASPADEIYGDEGVFRVQFPGQPPPECPGPNYIVQYYNVTWAIVQSSNFSTLFLLSREQNPPETDIDAWLLTAGRLGSNLTSVTKTNQTGCLFT